MTIHLAPMLPSRSSDLPGNSGGPPSNVPLFGLAPGGVCQAPVVTDGTGELLPHLFTLTRHSVSEIFEHGQNGHRKAGRHGLSKISQAECRAVSFLWHFPSCRQDWALPSTLSCGARTFLPPALRLWNPFQGFFRYRSPQTECGAAVICPALTYVFMLPHFPFSENARLLPSK